MLKANFIRYDLHFRKPSGTSRGILTTKTSWFIVVSDNTLPEWRGIGEVGHLNGLSPEPFDSIEPKLKDVCEQIDAYLTSETGLENFPSIRFALEQIHFSLHQKKQELLFPSDFTKGKMDIPINGLIWMGPKEEMRKQIREKIDSGWKCVKLKIGALHFEDELSLLRELRKEFSAAEIEIRVDANGAFSIQDAAEKINRLSELNLQSIEQPIAVKQWEEMAKLCRTTALPIALDEELIGISTRKEKLDLLAQIRPQYIILKPSLIGGIRSSLEWIQCANDLSIGWWITSALESNVGLNAIAQWTATLQNPMPQGLGTGQLYTNNIDSPLSIENCALHFDPSKKFTLPF
jgi:o-succinylbenzoate synthase